MPYKKFPGDHGRRLRPHRHAAAGRSRADRHHVFLARREREPVEADGTSHVEGGRRLSPDRRRLLRLRPVERIVQLHARLHAGAESERVVDDARATRSRASCSAIPSSGDITVGTPNSFYVHYMAGYAQDDFRITNALTVTAGLRYEYETGLGGEGQPHDRRLRSRRARFRCRCPGMNLRGGLMYAGVDGYQTYQGDPSSTQFAPRVGAAYSLNEKTVSCAAATGCSGRRRSIRRRARTSYRHARIHGDHDVFREQRWRTDAGGHADQSVPERHRAAAGQRGRPRDRRGRRRPLRRSVRQAGLRAAVLDRSAARAARAHRGVGRLRRQPIGSAGGGRHGGRDGEHQSDSDRIPVARIGAAADGGESVLRQRGVRRAQPIGDDRARAVAAAVSAVRQHLRASRHGGEGALSLDGAEGGAAASRTAGARASTTPAAG